MADTPTTTTTADEKAAALAASLASLPAAELAGRVRACQDAMDGVEEFKPQAAACSLIAAIMGDDAPAGGVRYCDARPLGAAIAGLIDNWPPGPVVDLATLADASAEMRRLCGALDAGYSVDPARIDAAQAAYHAAWGG